MNPIDQDALTRGLAACGRESPARSRQLDTMLADPSSSWERVARFAGYSAQIDSLGLMPWQNPPCRASLDDLNRPFGDPSGRRESAEVLQRLSRNGLSKFEPDPLAAIAAAEAV